MILSRRQAVTLTAASLAAGGAARAATMAPPPPTYRDMIYGDPNAKLTVVEYASLTCHFCADFHNVSFPKLEADYIDTGKINFVYRDFPTDGASAAAALMARCAPGDGGKAMIAATYRNQKDWIMSPAPFDLLVGYAGASGMAAADIEACLKNQPMLDAITAVRDDALATYKLKVTPTFIVGAAMVEGSNYDQLKAAIDTALAALPEADAKAKPKGRAK